MARLSVYGRILMNLLVCLSLSSQTICQQETSADDLYSETPCELRPLSAYKDNQDNLWGIGDGSLWWFNSTNLSWSVLPLPNGTSAVDSWKVICSDPQRYVIVSSLSSTLILHLPWQRWQVIDTEDVLNGAIDPGATWCKGGILFAADSSKSSLYVLDHEEARWTLLLEQLEPDELNVTTDIHLINDFSRTWITVNGNFVLVSGKDTCDHMLMSNATGLGWSLLKKKEKDRNEPWPDLNGQAITWVQENLGPTLWLWRISNGSNALWAFNMTEAKWEDKSKLLFCLPKMDYVLTTWVSEDKLCYLKRTGDCSAQYSASMTECWDGLEKNYTTTTESSTTDSTEPRLEVHATGIIAKIVDFETPQPLFISAHSVINKHALLSALQSEIDGPDTSDDIPITAVIPARHTPWHQHTSVFGSIIFFGTSLTIFGVVGSFWCMRRCVHFPKEALLLRDPPSVRYTAIPDNVSYDNRAQASSAYTVIPDSIA